jgi:hypothetical protein
VPIFLKIGIFRDELDNRYSDNSVEMEGINEGAGDTSRRSSRKTAVKARKKVRRSLNVRSEQEGSSSTDDDDDEDLYEKLKSKSCWKERYFLYNVHK